MALQNKGSTIVYLSESHTHCVKPNGLVLSLKGNERLKKLFIREPNSSWTLGVSGLALLQYVEAYPETLSLHELFDTFKSLFSVFLLI